MSMKIALETLGCKVNQYESSHAVEALTTAGHSMVSFKDRADVYVVHGCAVTSRASYETRQLLRRARRINPNAALVAMGCEAQRDPRRLAGEKLATHIIGNAHKHDLVRHLEEHADTASPFIRVSDMARRSVFQPMPVNHMLMGRTRAYVKVQDGCNAFCSYCVIPFTRGRSRSLPAGEVLDQVRRFLDHDYKEMVLTGIHLGQWGRDFSPQQELSDLLHLMDQSEKPARIRLSSLEPMEWLPSLLEAMPRWPWLCPHFHIPLQSGDDHILQLMGRPYRKKDYRELIETLRQSFPQCALGADVLVGFPGETPEHFAGTLAFIEKLPLSYLHVFPFSPRPGTRAYAWKERATGPELKRRARALQKLGRQKRKAFQDKFMGRWVEALVESEVGEGWWRATSDNYLQVIFQGTRDTHPGHLTPLRISHREKESLIATAP